MQKSPGARPNLPEQIRSLIHERIVEGELAPGSRINEVRLAEELGVSRTPLREAMMGLVAEGALSAIPRRGFFVLPLSEEELRHIYPIRGLLDPEALRLSGLPPHDRISRLRKLNERMRRAKDAAERVRLDDAWHIELVVDCPNPVLLDLIREFMARTRRYELAFYRERSNLEMSTGDHANVLDAAERKDLEAAIEALRVNLTSGFEPILAWLRQASELQTT